MRAVVVGTFLSAVVLAGCCAAGPPSGPGEADPCQFGAVVFDVGPVALCKQAVALAQERLGSLHWPVTSTRFRQELCQPNARCAPLQNEGWVIFTFSIGDPSMIHVAPDVNGVVVAENLQAVPGWLLEEIEQENSSNPKEPQGAGG